MLNQNYKWSQLCQCRKKERSYLNIQVSPSGRSQRTLPVRTILEQTLRFFNFRLFMLMLLKEIPSLGSHSQRNQSLITRSVRAARATSVQNHIATRNLNLKRVDNSSLSPLCRAELEQSLTLRPESCRASSPLPQRPGVRLRPGVRVRVTVTVTGPLAAPGILPPLSRPHVRPGSTRLVTVKERNST
jgi:hypothetical protein